MQGRAMLRSFIRAFAGGTILALVAGSVPAAASTEAAPPVETAQQTTVLRMDLSQAAEFAGDMRAGAQVWNDNVSNVRIEVAAPGQFAEIRVIADNGWPRAHLGPVRPGRQVTVWFGRQAVVEGYHRVRIAAHELGHSLGLPDRKPGPCSSLMSGSTAGVGCTNPIPDAVERRWVEANYGSGPAGQRPLDGRLIDEAQHSHDEPGHDEPVRLEAQPMLTR